jgi:YVTN family beta-propeller protein
MRFPWLFLVLAACAGGAAPSAAVAPVPARADVLLVANKQAGTVSFLDPKNGTQLAVVEVGTGPHEIAVSPDGAVAVVTNYGSKEEPGRSLSVLDVAARKVTRTVDLGEHRRPHGVAFLPGGNQVVVTVEVNQAVLVVDLGDGRVTRVVPTAQQGSHMVVVAADGKRAFTANIGSGTVSALDLSGASETRSAPVAAHSEAIALVAGGRELWIGSNQENTVSILDAQTLAPLAKLEAGTTPIRVNGTPDGRTVLVTNVQSHGLQIFDVATRREVGRVDFGAESYPVGTLVAPDGRTAFVALIARNQVAVVDLERRVVTATFATGLGPDGLGYARGG